MHIKPSVPLSIPLDYVRKDKLPNCRYFAFEYKNRIYHFYNAYYYVLRVLFSLLVG